MSRVDARMRFTDELATVGDHSHLAGIGSGQWVMVAHPSVMHKDYYMEVEMPGILEALEAMVDLLDKHTPARETTVMFSEPILRDALEFGWVEQRQDGSYFVTKKGWREMYEMENKE